MKKEKGLFKDRLGILLGLIETFIQETSSTKKQKLYSLLIGRSASDFKVSLTLNAF